MHKNVLENSGPDTSNALHCLDTFIDTCIYTQTCINFFKTVIERLKNKEVL